jgi:DNA-directed RNA polymerase subunit RPC12/RpoP
MTDTSTMESTKMTYIRNEQGHYVCPECGAIKAKQNTMHYHMKTHEGHLPFKCQTCKKEFLHSQTLALHISARHSKNEANYITCPSCPFKSLTKSNCIVHFMRRHCEEEVKLFSKNGLTCSCEKVCNSNTAFLYHISQCIELPVEKQQLLQTLL